MTRGAEPLPPPSEDVNVASLGNQLLRGDILPHSAASFTERYSVGHQILAPILLQLGIIYGVSDAFIIKIETEHLVSINAVYL